MKVNDYVNPLYDTHTISLVFREEPAAGGGVEGGEPGTGDVAPVSAIQIDDAEYSLNETGDAVDKDGNVVYTKAEIDEMSDEDDAAGDGDDDDKSKVKPDSKTVSIKSISKLTGIEVKKDGKVLEFEDSVEGFAKRELAVVEQVRKDASAKALKAYLDANPEFNAAYKHYVVNGTLKGFSNKTSYADVKLATLSADQKVKIIREDLKQQGLSDARINAFVTSIVNSDGIDGEAADSLASLISKEKESGKSIDDAYNKKLNDEATRIKKYTTAVKSVVTSGKVKDLKIPDTMLKVHEDGSKSTVTRAEFLEYMTVPVFVNESTGEKYTQYQYDFENRLSTKTVEDDIVDGISMFLGSKSNALDILKESKMRKDIILKKKSKSNRPSGVGRVTGKVRDEDIILKH